jgi:hypothetical protein
MSLFIRYLALVLLGLLVAGCGASKKMVEITSEPQAEAYFEDKLLGPTKEEPTEYEIRIPKDDKGELSVRKEGFIPATRIISKEDDQELSFSFELEPVNHTEIVFVSTDPQNADVFFNEEYLCATPCEIEIDDKDPGAKRLIKIEKRGFQPKMLRLKYKGDNYKDDNFFNTLRVIMEPAYYNRQGDGSGGGGGGGGGGGAANATNIIIPGMGGLPMMPSPQYQQQQQQQQQQAPAPAAPSVPTIQAPPR